MTSLALRPKDFNPNVYEGREARRSGLPMVHRYGECAAAKEWEQGWKSEDATSDVPVMVIRPNPPVSPVPASVPTPAPTPVERKLVTVKANNSTTGRRGRPPATGRFATRDELVSAIMARVNDDPKIIAGDVGVSFMTVQKIIEGAK